MAEFLPKLRITFVIPYFYPAWEFGGQPRSAYELARVLAERGHFVKVLTTDSGGRARLKEKGSHRRQNVDGIEVLYYRNLSNWLAYRYRLFWPISMFRELENEMNGSHVVHIHELRSTTSVLAYQAVRRLGIPYVLSGHGGLRRLGRATAKSAYDRLWGNNILRDAGAVLAISPVEDSDAQTMGVEPERIQRLPNIVRSDDYQNLPQAGAFRRRWSIPSGQIILFLGRLHPVKGADLLIQAFGRISQSEPETYLVIAGPDDGQESELRRAVSRLKLESRVTFTGFLDLHSKREAFVDASVVVVPSRSEVFAITALEALMSGTPILLSSVCGIDRVPEVRTSAMFFRNEDVEDLTAKLAAIIRDKHYRTAARKSQQLIDQIFSAQAIGSQAEKIYRSVIEELSS